MKQLTLGLMMLIFAWVLISERASANEVSEPQQAISTFRQIWDTDLSKSLRNNSYYPFLKKQVFEPGMVGASRITSEEARRRTSTLSLEEQKTLILSGDLTLLKGDRPIWAVANGGGVGSGFEAYIDQKTGKLLLLWIIPEG